MATADCMMIPFLPCLTCVPVGTFKERRNSGLRRRAPASERPALYSLFPFHELPPALPPAAAPALAPLAFADEEDGRTSIRFGRAASLSGAVISSTPLLYSAETLEVSTPSGSTMVRSMRP